MRSLNCITKPYWIYIVYEEQHETFKQEYATYNEYDDKMTTITLRLQQLQLGHIGE